MILANDKKKIPKNEKSESIVPVKQGFLSSWPNLYIFLRWLYISYISGMELDTTMLLVTVDD